MKNLKLHKETIRKLQDEELTGVAGGGTGGMVATIPNTNAFVCLSDPCMGLTETCQCEVILTNDCFVPYTDVCMF